MSRLGAYLLRLFSAEAAALFGVAVLLLFLVQCLRTFEVVSVRGQDLLTLAGQAALSMPTLGIVFLYVCLAMGLARRLRGLQESNELQVIHSSRRTGALLGAVAAYTLIGTLLVLGLSNFLEPATTRQFNERSASIAADLVTRTLTPARFTEVTPGVTMVIGARGDDGVLTNFFADDNRQADMRRTYMAESAMVAQDAQGFVLQLNNGSIQYMSDTGEFSRVSFERYDIALDRITGPLATRYPLAEANSFELVVNGMRSGWDPEAVRYLANRMGEGLRVIALCLFVTAIALFPHGRRRGLRLPVEIVMLAATFLERGVSAAFTSMPAVGSIGIIALSLPLLLVRLRVFAPVRRRAEAAA